MMTPQPELPDNLPEVVRLLISTSGQGESAWVSQLEEAGYQEITTTEYEGTIRKDFRANRFPDLHLYLSGNSPTSASMTLACSSDDHTSSTQQEYDDGIAYFEQKFVQAMQFTAEATGPPDLDAHWDAEDYPPEEGADRVALWRLPTRLLKLRLSYATDTAPFSIQLWLDFV